MQLTKYFHPNKGGIESNVLGISEELAKRGQEVLVLASNLPPTKKFEKYKGIKIKRSSIFFTLFRDPFTPGMFLDLLGEDYDLIHLHLPDPFNSILAVVASFLRRKPLVVTYHADIIKKRWYHQPFTFLYSFFQSLTLKKASLIIATSPSYAKESPVLRKFEFWEKLEVVPNFVDEKKFSIKKTRGKGKVIFFLGRLIPYKGVSYLIKAFPQVKEKIKDAQLIIAGRGPLKKELRKESRGMDGISFIEPNDEELPSLYANCDIFVLPSVTRQEAFGITLLEAMISGKPCISTNISGMPFVIGDSGILVPPRNSKALGKAIIKILSDEKLAEKLGEKAKKRVEENFTKEKVVDKLIEVYRKCV